MFVATFSDYRKSNLRSHTGPQQMKLTEKLTEKVNEMPYTVALLVAMWLVLSAVCLLFYFIPTEATGASVTTDIPKIMSEGWKYVTGAAVSALATLSGRNNAKKVMPKIAGNKTEEEKEE
jgi:hypothetical protein